MKFNSALVLGASLTGLLVVVPAAGNGPQTLQEQAEIALGISASELGSVSLDVAVDGGFTVDFAGRNQSFSMTLNSHSVRAPGFEVRVQDADGWSTQEPGPVTTYRGTVNGAPGSAVAASAVACATWTGGLAAADTAGDGAIAVPVDEWRGRRRRSAAQRLARAASQPPATSFGSAAPCGFTVAFDSQVTPVLPYDAKASLVKEKLEALSTIGSSATSMGMPRFSTSSTI